MRKRGGGAEGRQTETATRKPDESERERPTNNEWVSEWESERERERRMRDRAKHE